MPASDVLTVRTEQLATFAAAQLLSFEREAVEHVRSHLPDHHAALGEAGTLAGVRQGIAEARAHGLLSATGAAIYIRLLFVFGEGFAERCAWARDALAQGGDEASRVARLAAAAVAHTRALLDAEEGAR